MPTEILRPDAFGASNGTLFTGSGYGTTVSAVNDDSDSTYVGVEFGGDNVHVKFPTPTGDPDSTQTFYARLRKGPSANNSNPEWHLRENNTNRASLGSVSLTSESFSEFSKTWNASSLVTTDGSLAELFIDGVGGLNDYWDCADAWWDCNYTSGGVTGTASITEADDSLNADGEVAVDGDATVTEGDDTLSAAGEVTDPAITGTTDATEADDSLDASGAVAIAGTASPTEADDTLDASGAADIAGTADISEAGDSLTASGGVSIGGTATITEAGDTLSAEAAAAIAGTASVTEADDSLTGAGAVAIAGSATLTEDDDALSASSGASTSGSLDVTEADDTITAAGSVAIAGTASIGEAGDTLTGSATVAVSGSVAIAEADDSLDAEGSLGAVPVDGTVAITEADDAISASGAVAVAGDATLTEDADTLDGAGSVAVTGSLTVTESGDTLSAVGSTPLPITDPLEAIESALSGISGVTLYRNRIRPIPAEDLPAINIRWLRERVGRFDKLDVIDRDASIGIIIKTDGDTADDQVDAWCEDIETAVYNDATLAALLSENIELQSTGLEWDDGADKVYLTATMVWSARYATTEQDPDTPR